MKTGFVLLARMGSSRLPGKVLKDVCGKPMLEHILERLQKVRINGNLVLATSVNPMDDVLQEFCEKRNVSVFRGSENNVLDRCIKAAEAYQLDVIIRMGADTPFADREVIQDMLDTFLKEHEKGNRLDYLSNAMERSYPLGIDADVMTLECFRKIERFISTMPREARELNEINVVPVVHQNPDKFKLYAYKKDFDYSHLRWTLDTPEDLDLTRRVYEALYPKTPDFLMRDILKLLEIHPDWSQINAKIIPRSGYWTPTEKEKLNKKLKQ